MDGWQCRNNLFIIKIEAGPQESYFDTLKITEDIENETNMGQFELAKRGFTNWARREEED
jgi:hypothetical protein